MSSPYVPTIAPPYEFETVDAEALFDVPPEDLTQRAPTEMTASMAKRFLVIGLGGAFLGAVASAGVTALALRSYKQSDSPWTAALWAGAGSLAFGGLTVYLLSRALEEKNADLLSATVGAKAAF